MRFHNLDLNLLVALNALLAERNVSAAAECLHLTQSAMSHALGRLRRHFDDELLVPAGRGLILTSRAEALIGPLREAIFQIGKIVGESPIFDPATSTRRFAVSASDYSLSVLVARAISKMKSLAPAIGFDIAYTEEPRLRLERGEMDLVILPQQYLLPTYPYAELYQDEYVVIVWSESHLAEQDIDIDRYFELGHIVVRFGLSHHSEFAEGIGLATPRALRVDMTASSFAQVPLLLVGTDLLASIPRRLAEILSRALPLTVKPLPFQAPKIHECVQWNKMRVGDSAINWVVEQLQACGGDLYHPINSVQ